ncbi:MAG: hypothetical protein KF813_00515 [Trueperaceae bacterium]|nr:hypothetical protein [Trueperaceae bacterium]
MSHKSKGTITNMIASALVLAAYVTYALRRGAGEPESLQSWALTILVFIGIAVAVSIVAQIVFRIGLSIAIGVTERTDDSARINRVVTSSLAEDEMDRQIGMRADRVGYVCAGIGVVGMLVMLAFGAPLVASLHVLLGSFALGSLVAGAVSVHGYERGFVNA